MKVAIRSVIFYVLICLITGCSSGKDVESAKLEADNFRRLMDAKLYSKIYRNASNEITENNTETQFSELMLGICNKLGKHNEVNILSSKINKNLSTDDSIILVYHVKFDRGDGIETLFFKKREGKIIISGYNIQSVELIK
jgi:hypothetical protein